MKDIKILKKIINRQLDTMDIESIDNMEVLESDKHPFEESIVGESRIRTFNKDVLTEELVWHRDKEDRLVEIIEGNGWELQLDNELPVKMNDGDSFIIPEGVYHRVKRGSDKLVIKITALV